MEHEERTPSSPGTADAACAHASWALRGSEAGMHAGIVGAPRGLPCRRRWRGAAARQDWQGCCQQTAKRVPKKIAAPFRSC
eukprot:365071-Chlamydomonas_euryale.AAC.7